MSNPDDGLGLKHRKLSIDDGTSPVSDVFNKLLFREIPGEQGSYASLPSADLDLPSVLEPENDTQQTCSSFGDKPADGDFLAGNSVENAEGKMLDIELHREGSSQGEVVGSRSKSCCRQELLLPWMAMILAVLAMSSIGPCFKYIEGKGITAALAVSWRSQCMVIFLVPMAFLEKIALPKETGNVDWLGKKPDLPFPVLFHVSLAGLAWGGNVTLWVVALKYTSAVHASLLTSTQPLILCIYYTFVGEHISALEWMGMMVAMVGIVTASLSGLVADVEGGSGNGVMSEIFGDSLCLISAIFEVFIMLNRQKVKPYVPLMQYTALTSFYVAIVSTTATLLIEESEFFTISDQSVFGWMSHRWAHFMLLFGLFVGVVCIAGFNYAVQHIHPLIFASLHLIDPVTTGVIAWSIGVEGVPGVTTWIGGFIIGVGVVALVVGEHLRNHASKDHNTGIEMRPACVDSRSNVEYSQLNTAMDDELDMSVRNPISFGSAVGTAVRNHDMKGLPQLESDGQIEDKEFHIAFAGAALHGPVILSEQDTSNLACILHTVETRIRGFSLDRQNISTRQANSSSNDDTSLASSNQSYIQGLEAIE